ncbi:hypothetical protein WICMUC_001937 [Wickerhamomyces mucosus]|uniref:RRM domain-containing protein n=1 Tax=Wickerhamomyces mucosus TaxID=1378264 RepID=A0A9P8TG12_9ASCO|nr:hypothetical protein WICMUC_001937 [Wickerhamomyces mucosus]
MSASKKSESSTEDDSLDRKTLFVRSIPFDVTSEQLSDFFSQFCPVKHAVVVTDNENQSRGFGFVSFSLDEDTTTALDQSRSTKLNGRLLRVDIAKRRDRKDKGAVKPERQAIEKRRARLIIRNLPWSVRSPDELKKIFQKYGAVTDVIIPRKEGGKMSGFAFVTMKKNSSAEQAIKQSVGLKIAGREVAVDYALEKSKWLEYKDEHDEGDSEDERDSEHPEKTENEGNDDSDDDEIIPEQEIEDQESDTADVAEEDDEDSEIELESDEEVEDEDDADEEEQRRPAAKRNTQEKFSIFVRNLPYDTDENALKEHFEHWGPVKYALPVIDRETGLAKGTGFVAFLKEDAFTKCIENAPDSSSTSILISDDVSPEYVFEGRILSLTPTVDRESAARLTEKNAVKRSELLGKAPTEKDRRNLYLLNEGRITENSKLASSISKTDLELREKSYKLRVQHLNKNPSLHLSLTRLAIRNLPRALNAKALKALGRKAVVQFATEVKEKKRQPLSKEEVIRSQKEKERWLDGEKESNNSKKQGVVKQAKIIMEVKGSGDTGRSRGYGFLEFRDHKAALMGLRWLNAHEVTVQEILEGLTDEEKKLAELEGISKRKLIVEFAIEHANIIKRRREKINQARHDSGEAKRKRGNGEDEQETKEFKQIKRSKVDKKDNKNSKKPQKKGNMNKGSHVGAKKDDKTAPKRERPDETAAKLGLDDNTKKLIGIKRKRKQQKKGRA